MAIRFIISLFFAIIVTFFALQNSSSVEISIFFNQYTISQALVIFISAILGAIIVLLLGIIKQIKLKLKIKNSTKTINYLQEENTMLKQRVEELMVTTTKDMTGNLSEEDNTNNSEDTPFNSVD